MLALRGISGTFTVAAIPVQASCRPSIGSVVLRRALIPNLPGGRKRTQLVSCVGHEQSEVLPTATDLDLNFDSHQAITSFLKLLEARSADKSLIQLWSFCKPLTESFLIPYHGVLKKSGEWTANNVAVHVHLFCNKLENMTTSTAGSTHDMDMYIGSHMCLKVRACCIRRPPLLVLHCSHVCAAALVAQECRGKSQSLGVRHSPVQHGCSSWQN